VSARNRKKKGAAPAPAADDLDFYTTPAWCVRAILPYVTQMHPNEPRIIDPCAGEGAILRVVRAELSSVSIFAIELDRERARACCSVSSVSVGDALRFNWDADAAVMNPPFSNALGFVQHGVEQIEECRLDAVWALLRLGFLASQKRAQWLREHVPDVYPLPARPSFTPDGRTDATDYAWYCWHKGSGTRPGKVQPLSLEGTGYEAEEEAASVRRKALDFRAAPQPRVHCYGEVVDYKGMAFKHDAPVAFGKSEVEIKEVARTQKLVCDLYNETLEARRAAGHIIVGSGHNKRDLGTPAQIAARKAAVAEFNRSFAEQLIESEKEGLGLLGLIKMMAEEKR